MSLVYPLVSVLGFVCGKVADKVNFNKNRIKPALEMFIVFTVILVGTAALTIIRRPAFPFLDIQLVLLLIVIILISFFQNQVDFKGVEQKDLSFREPIYNLQPILTSFIAYILFPSERETKFLVGIGVGTFILYLGSFHKKEKLHFDKGTLYLFLAVFTGAILSNLYKIGLEKISPELFILVRVIGILLLLMLFNPFRLDELNKDRLSWGIAAGVVYLIGTVANLYSIKYLGLNFTVMILLAGPALTYFLSHIVLKEKLSLRRMITSFLLVLLVLIITFA